MKNILKKMALLAIPVVLWLVFFAAFEPNNYFGLKASASSSQPVARVRAYQQAPGTNLILGDSRLAHFDMQLVNSLTGQPWQNLAFGGASLKETLDLADYILNSGHEVDTLLAEVSFYTLNAGYNTDRFAALEETLNNPLAYCFNLEYNVNALTVAMDTLRGTPDTIESGDWTESDYLADDGTVLNWYPQEDLYGDLILPASEEGRLLLFDFSIYTNTIAIDHPEGWEPSGDDWWWPPTDLGLADTSWDCDEWTLELRYGDCDPDYAGLANLYECYDDRMDLRFFGVWRMEDDCLRLDMSAGVGSSLSGSFPVLISPSGEYLYFQRSRIGEGMPFLRNGEDSTTLSLRCG